MIEVFLAAGLTPAEHNALLCEDRTCLSRRSGRTVNKHGLTTRAAPLLASSKRSATFASRTVIPFACRFLDVWPPLLINFANIKLSPQI